MKSITKYYRNELGGKYDNQINGEIISQFAELGTARSNVVKSIIEKHSEYIDNLEDLKAIMYDTANERSAD